MMEEGENTLRTEKRGWQSARQDKGLFWAREAEPKGDGLAEIGPYCLTIIYSDLNG